MQPTTAHSQRDLATTDDDRRAATAVLHLVQVDPRRAGELAVAIIDRAGDRKDHATVAVARRAAGLAALHTSHLDTAAEHLRAAVRSARAAHSPQLAGEARMSLAFVLMRRGEARQGLRTIDTALTELDGVEHARALAQRGAIRQQLGRLNEALADYRLALPTLSQAGDWVWVQRIHANRGVLFIYRSQLGPAAAELRAAEQVCSRHGLDLDLAFVCDNYGFLHLRRGDIPAALHWLDEAERRLGSLGAQVVTVLIDRSELLLSLRLVAEARENATRAIEEAQRLRREIAVPQAQLVVCEVGLLDGDATGALAAAQSALHAFSRQRRPEWVALARYAVLRCRLAMPEGRPVGISEVARAADRLHSAGWTAPARDARILAARMALAREEVQRAAELLHQVPRNPSRGPVEVRARAWHARALLDLAAGRRRTALSALRTGIRLLEEHQATLGAADLRTSASAHRTDLVDLGLGLALGSRRPREVLAWAERGRATALLMRPVRPPSDPVLAQLLTELRATVQQADDSRGTPRVHEALIRHQSTLECAIRDHVRAGRDSTHTDERPGSSQLAVSLGEAALVEFVQYRGELLAVTLADSRARLVSLGEAAAVQELTAHLPYMLRRLSRQNGRVLRGARDAASMQVLRFAAEQLDERLMRPLLRGIGERPLVIVPAACQQSVIWSLLPSCVGRPITIAPSAALWHHARSESTRRGSTVVVAGPGLPAAPAEAAAVAALYPGAQCLAGADADVAAVKAALSSSGVAHIAAHGHFRVDNPLFSSLQLHDGPLTVYDLDSLSEAPRLVVLAACDGGSNAVCTGDELLGLAAGFLTLGTGSLIAPVGPVSDGDISALMVELHARLREGLPPATALARVQRAAADGPPGTVAAAAGLVCLGAGDAPSPVQPVGRDPSTGPVAARRGV
jgi:tetratricopeptide (TPR) repeat protein